MSEFKSEYTLPEPTKEEKEKYGVVKQSFAIDSGGIGNIVVEGFSPKQIKAYVRYLSKWDPTGSPPTFQAARANEKRVWLDDSKAKHKNPYIDANAEKEAAMDEQEDIADLEAQKKQAEMEQALYTAGGNADAIATGKKSAKSANAKKEAKSKKEAAAKEQAAKKAAAQWPLKYKKKGQLVKKWQTFLNESPDGTAIAATLKVKNNPVRRGRMSVDGVFGKQARFVTKVFFQGQQSTQVRDAKGELFSLAALKKAKSSVTKAEFEKFTEGAFYHKELPGIFEKEWWLTKEGKPILDPSTGLAYISIKTKHTSLPAEETSFKLLVMGERAKAMEALADFYYKKMPQIADPEEDIDIDIMGKPTKKAGMINDPGKSAKLNYEDWEIDVKKEGAPLYLLFSYPIEDLQQWEFREPNAHMGYNDADGDIKYYTCSFETIKFVTELQDLAAKIKEVNSRFEAAGLQAFYNVPGDFGYMQNPYPLKQIPNHIKKFYNLIGSFLVQNDVALPSASEVEAYKQSVEDGEVEKDPSAASQKEKLLKKEAESGTKHAAGAEEPSVFMQELFAERKAWALKQSKEKDEKSAKTQAAPPTDNLDAAAKKKPTYIYADNGILEFVFEVKPPTDLSLSKNAIIQSASWTLRSVYFNGRVLTTGLNVLQKDPTLKRTEVLSSIHYHEQWIRPEKLTPEKLPETIRQSFTETGPPAPGELVQQPRQLAGEDGLWIDYLLNFLAPVPIIKPALKKPREPREKFSGEFLNNKYVKTATDLAFEKELIDPKYRADVMAMRRNQREYIGDTATSAFIEGCSEISEVEEAYSLIFNKIDFTTLRSYLAMIEKYKMDIREQNMSEFQLCLEASEISKIKSGVLASLHLPVGRMEKILSSLDYRSNKFDNAFYEDLCTRNLTELIPPAIWKEVFINLNTYGVATLLGASLQALVPEKALLEEFWGPLIKKRGIYWNTNPAKSNISEGGEIIENAAGQGTLERILLNEAKLNFQQETAFANAGIETSGNKEIYQVKYYDKILHWLTPYIKYWPQDITISIIAKCIYEEANRGIKPFKVTASAKNGKKPENYKVDMNSWWNSPVLPKDERGSDKWTLKAAYKVAVGHLGHMAYARWAKLKKEGIYKVADFTKAVPFLQADAITSVMVNLFLGNDALNPIYGALDDDIKTEMKKTDNGLIRFFHRPASAAALGASKTTIFPACEVPELKKTEGPVFASIDGDAVHGAFARELFTDPENLKTTLNFESVDPDSNKGTIDDFWWMTGKRSGSFWDYILNSDQPIDGARKGLGMTPKDFMKMFFNIGVELGENNKNKEIPREMFYDAELTRTAVDSALSVKEWKALVKKELLNHFDTIQSNTAGADGKTKKLTKKQKRKLAAEMRKEMTEEVNKNSAELSFGATYFPSDKKSKTADSGGALWGFPGILNSHSTNIVNLMQHIQMNCSTHLWNNKRMDWTELFSTHSELMVSLESWYFNLSKQAKDPLDVAVTTAKSEINELDIVLKKYTGKHLIDYVVAAWNATQAFESPEGLLAEFDDGAVKERANQSNISKMIEKSKLAGYDSFLTRQWFEEVWKLFRTNDKFDQLLDENLPWDKIFRVGGDKNGIHTRNKLLRYINGTVVDKDDLIRKITANFDEPGVNSDADFYDQIDFGRLVDAYKCDDVFAALLKKNTPKVKKPKVPLKLIKPPKMPRTIDPAVTDMIESVLETVMSVGIMLAKKSIMNAVGQVCEQISEALNKLLNNLACSLQKAQRVKNEAIEAMQTEIDKPSKYNEPPPPASDDADAEAAASAGEEPSFADKALLAGKKKTSALAKGVQDTQLRAVQAVTAESLGFLDLADICKVLTGETPPAAEAAIATAIENNKESLPLGFHAGNVMDIYISIGEVVDDTPLEESDEPGPVEDLCAIINEQLEEILADRFPPNTLEGVSERQREKKMNRLKKLLMAGAGNLMKKEEYDTAMKEAVEDAKDSNEAINEAINDMIDVFYDPVSMRFDEEVLSLKRSFLQAQTTISFVPASEPKPPGEPQIEPVSAIELISQELKNIEENIHIRSDDQGQTFIAIRLPMSPTVLPSGAIVPSALSYWFVIKSLKTGGYQFLIEAPDGRVVSNNIREAAQNPEEFLSAALGLNLLGTMVANPSLAADSVDSSLAGIVSDYIANTVQANTKHYFGGLMKSFLASYAEIIANSSLFVTEGESDLTANPPVYPIYKNLENLQLLPDPTDPTATSIFDTDSVKVNIRERRDDLQPTQGPDRAMSLALLESTVASEIKLTVAESAFMGLFVFSEISPDVALNEPHMIDIMKDNLRRRLGNDYADFVQYAARLVRARIATADYAVLTDADIEDPLAFLFREQVEIMSPGLTDLFSEEDEDETTAESFEPGVKGYIEDLLEILPIRNVPASYLPDAEGEGNKSPECTLTAEMVSETGGLILETYIRAYPRAHNGNTPLWEVNDEMKKSVLDAKAAFVNGRFGKQDANIDLDELGNKNVLQGAVNPVAFQEYLTELAARTFETPAAQPYVSVDYVASQWEVFNDLNSVSLVAGEARYFCINELGVTSGTEFDSWDSPAEGAWITNTATLAEDYPPNITDWKKDLLNGIEEFKNSGQSAEFGKFYKTKGGVTSLLNALETDPGAQQSSWGLGGPEYAYYTNWIPVNKLPAKIKKKLNASGAKAAYARKAWLFKRSEKTSVDNNMGAVPVTALFSASPTESTGHPWNYGMRLSYVFPASAPDGSESSIEALLNSTSQVPDFGGDNIIESLIKEKALVYRCKAKDKDGILKHRKLYSMPLFDYELPAEGPMGTLAMTSSTIGNFEHGPVAHYLENVAKSDLMAGLSAQPALKYFIEGNMKPIPSYLTIYTMIMTAIKLGLKPTNVFSATSQQISVAREAILNYEENHWRPPSITANGGVVGRNRMALIKDSIEKRKE